MLKAIRFVKKFFMHLILVVWCISVGMIFYWLIVASLKDNKTVFRELWALPEKLDFSNYVNAWNSLNFARYSLNSFIVVTSSLIILLFISTLAAYAITRMKIRFANPLTYFFIAGMGIPSQLLFVPMYKILISIKLIDTLGGLVLVYVAWSIPFTVFLLTGFFLTIPSELEDAAFMDGCSEFKTFYKIIIPMAAPGILTGAIFNFIGLWNEFMIALIFTTDPNNKTMALGLYHLQASLQYTSDWGSIFAGAVMVLIPTAIVFLVLADRLISGITFGAIK